MHHAASQPLNLGLYAKAHELPWHLYGIIRTSLDETPINRRHRTVFGAKSHHPMAFLPAH